MYTKTLLYFICISILSACSYSTQKQMNSSPKIESFYHKYLGESNANALSAFKLINRKIEFEYLDIEPDSSALVLIMLTSGLNEGSLKSDIEVILNNGEILLLELANISSNDYVESYNYNTSAPVTKMKTITDPGGIDLVNQPDGTVKHVTRLASTKTVNVTEQQVTNHSGSKTQIFNKAHLRWTKEHITAIKRHGINKFVINFEYASLEISPRKSQNKELKKRL